MVGILERVLVEVDGSWSEALGRHLLRATVRPDELIGQAFEAASDLLRRQQLVHRASIMRRPQLQLLQMVRLWQHPSTNALKLAVMVIAMICVHVAVAGGAAVVLGRLADFGAVLLGVRIGGPVQMRVVSAYLLVRCMLGLVHKVAGGGARVKVAFIRDARQVGHVVRLGHIHGVICTNNLLLCTIAILRAR